MPETVKTAVAVISIDIEKNSFHVVGLNGAERISLASSGHRDRSGQSPVRHDRLPLNRHRVLLGDARHAATVAHCGRRDILLVWGTRDSDHADAAGPVSAPRSCCVSHTGALSSSFCLDQADPSRPLMT
jgi:hypothetical protein